MRSGVIARKKGMTRVFTEDGTHVPVTVLALEECQVVGVRSEEKDGYTALQLGAGKRKVSRTNKPLRGQYAKAGVEPKNKMAEFRVTEDAVLEVGAEISADHFVEGQKVDVVGTSIGKGFAGAMKRHGFGGMRATHGVSVSHRAHGSTGNSQEPGKVWKGKKMAGHMGARRVTTQNLEVVKTDSDRGLILIKGAVPGSDGSWVLISDALKAKLPEGVPFPGSVKVAAVEEAPVEEAVPAEEAAAVEAAPAEEAPAVDASADDADKKD